MFPIPCKSASSVLVVPIPTICEVVWIPVIDVVNAPAPPPPPPWILMSTVVPFTANVLREILAANKGTEGQIQVSNKGLMKLEFNSDESSAEYFVVRQQ